MLDKETLKMFISLKEKEVKQIKKDYIYHLHLLKMMKEKLKEFK